MDAIKKVFETYSTSRIARDADLWLSIWDEDGLQLPPGSRARGKDVLRAVTPSNFEAMQVLTFDIQVDEITVLGEMAYARGYFTSDRIVNGAPQRMDGKFLTILKRQTDGSWKIYRDCFNSNL